MAKLRELKFFPQVTVGEWRQVWADLGGLPLTTEDKVYKETYRILKVEKRKIARRKNSRKFERLAAAKAAAQGVKDTEAVPLAKALAVETTRRKQAEEELRAKTQELETAV